ncbi:hypothetical protein GCM10010320_73700 [Streptomyces caelestis]|jgi:hypothetical protein|nr:hypothetical protein GCM10010320_73700 [Streptomyces caelestis]
MLAGTAVAVGLVGQPTDVHVLSASSSGASATVAVLSGAAAESTATPPEVDMRVAFRTLDFSAAV